MINIYPQINLNEKEVFLFWNYGKEDFSGTIIVFEGIFNFPILRWEDVLIPPNTTFFYKHFQNVNEYLSLDEFSGYRYLFLADNGERLDLDFTSSKNKSEIKGHDIYLFDDACGTYFENLCGEGKSYIFNNEPGWTIDIGANIGGYTAGALRFGAEKILAIEPNLNTYNSLKYTFSNFNNVFPVWGAVSNLNIDFIYGDFDIGNSVGNRVQDSGKIKVPNYKISQLVDFYKIDKIRLLKIDIEGEEYNVIPNLEDSVLDKTLSIHLETHHQYGGDDTHLINFLISKNFKYKLIEDRTSSVSVKEHLFWK